MPMLGTALAVVAAFLLGVRVGIAIGRRKAARLAQRSK